MSTTYLPNNKKNHRKRLRLRRNPNLVPELESEMATAELESEINNDSLPNLPIDLVAEIFCRLPVKLLVQLRCMCKSWNSLISDRSFTRKHLSLSTTRRLHSAKYKHEPDGLVHNSYPLDSVLSTEVKQQRLPFNSIVASCDGILCLCDKRKGIVVLWNPSIRKFKELPSPFENTRIRNQVDMTFGFGYDRVSDNYKVAVLYYTELDTTKGKVHTLGTNSWKTSEIFRFGAVCDEQPGTTVSGTINWMAYTEWRRKGPFFIVSFDLGNDSYQKLLPPDHAEISPDYLSLSVLMDCLCLISDHHIWIMKEYGIQDSWTKLFSVSYMQHPSECYILCNALYIFEDDRLLLDTHEFPHEDEDGKKKLVVYDPKNDTFEVTRFTNVLTVCLETLISPCS
ncbi:F-box/kelch-repeat protein At3g23880-like [Vicia villosa]|uniref:F-box/kelch-repeat protein At3g23880-like n=1 Tax=Vicia villosa TaxID=3911 RepID=UPI00273C6C85|nr:F-box/kelch-repeat protein At3g23880-like [Vicia villosa]XP_058722096.1 F-box/kelch-repeat protein At3g23880-like [Vicia villosa]XP_058722097.1 F-box/kelch-repeat protein At3g23880-like [Vicia villosa]